MMKTRNGRLMLSSKCAECGSKNSKFMKEQEAEGLFSSLGIKAPLKLVFNMIWLMANTKTKKKERNQIKS